MSKATIHVQVDPDVRLAVEEKAAADQRTISATVEILIKKALAADAEEPRK
jgi:hypothetical protein